MRTMRRLLLSAFLAVLAGSVVVACSADDPTRPAGPDYNVTVQKDTTGGGGSTQTTIPDDTTCRGGTVTTGGGGRC